MSANQDDIYDVAVIGAGPVGLYATFYAGMRHLRAIVLETLSRPGGQITALYPDKYVYDVAGFPAILGRDLVAALYKQSTQFGAEFRFDERVENLEVLEPKRIRLTTTQNIYYSKTAIIAAGIGAFKPNRLNVPGVAELEGRGISYVVKERKDFLGRRVLIIGGGDTAVDWALELRHWAKEVTLIHRFDYFEAHQGSAMALMNSEVKVHLQHVLARAHGNEKLERVTVRNLVTNAEFDLEVDDVLIFIGYQADLGPINRWGLKMQGRKIIVNHRMETSLPGVYAVGDVSQSEEGLTMNLMAYGFGQAAIAVGVAANFIYPEQRVAHAHSSHRTDLKPK